VLIPAALLAECQIQGAVELTVESGRLVITPVQAPRAGWFEGYQPEADEDAWEGLPVTADSGEWEW
jgi:antitoxin MazE